LSPALSNWIAPRAERVTARRAAAKANAVLQLLGAIAFHSININRTKEGVYEVIVYCKAHPDDKVVDAVRRLGEEGAAAGQSRRNSCSSGYRRPIAI
jgi:hypothetical protein